MKRVEGGITGWAVVHTISTLTDIFSAQTELKCRRRSHLTVDEGLLKVVANQLIVIIPKKGSLIMIVCNDCIPKFNYYLKLMLCELTEIRRTNV